MPRRRRRRIPAVNPDIIDALRCFRKRQPYKGSHDEKMEKFKVFLSVLSYYYNVDVPELYVTDPSKERNGFDEYLAIVKGCYGDGAISLRKFSVITLLHEFRHYLQEACPNIVRISRDPQEDANVWSHHVYKQVWHERYVELLGNNELNETRTVM